MLLVHGFASDHTGNWVRPGIVDALVATGRRVIAYDARGHGASDQSARGRRVRAQRDGARRAGPARPARGHRGRHRRLLDGCDRLVAPRTPRTAGPIAGARWHRRPPGAGTWRRPARAYRGRVARSAPAANDGPRPPDRSRLSALRGTQWQRSAGVGRRAARRRPPGRPAISDRSGFRRWSWPAPTIAWPVHRRSSPS